MIKKDRKYWSNYEPIFNGKMYIRKPAEVWLSIIILINIITYLLITK